MSRTAFPLALAALLCCGACSNAPLTPKSVSGTYTLRHGNWYAGEFVTLHDGGSFEYSVFSDVLDDPRLERFPVRGRSSL